MEKNDLICFYYKIVSLLLTLLHFIDSFFAVFVDKLPLKSDQSDFPPPTNLLFTCLVIMSSRYSILVET